MFLRATLFFLNANLCQSKRKTLLQWNINGALVRNTKSDKWQSNSSGSVSTGSIT